MGGGVEAPAKAALTNSFKRVITLPNYDSKMLMTQMSEARTQRSYDYYDCCSYQVPEKFRSFLLRLMTATVLHQS